MWCAPRRFGIAVSVVNGAGTAIITGNLISGAAHGAIVGMDHAKAVTGDLMPGADALRQSADQRQPGAVEIAHGPSTVIPGWREAPDPESKTNRGAHTWIAG